MASDLITTELVALDADFGDSVDSVITNLATLVHDTGRATEVTGLAQPAIDREAKAGTGVPGGVAIPHCRSEAVTEPTLAFARLTRGVDFSGPDGDAQLVFLIAAPAGGGKAHLQILSKLARALVTVKSTVGAGDAALAGYLLGRTQGQGPAFSLALSVTYGTAAAAKPGTQFPRPEELDTAHTSISAL